MMMIAIDAKHFKIQLYFNEKSLLLEKNNIFSKID